MSFFGFDPTKPPSQMHSARAPGFGPAPDPFAGLSGRGYEDEEGETLQFDDEVDDGLGNALEETGDDLNDATFGATNVGTDFDFSGEGGKPQASKPRAPDPFQFPPQNQQKQYAPRPAQTGYEKYKRPTETRNLQPDASLWGLGPAKSENRPMPQQQAPLQQTQPSKAARSMMTLDEVEAMMRSQPKKASPASPVAPTDPPRSTAQNAPVPSPFAQQQSRPAQGFPPPQQQNGMPMPSAAQQQQMRAAQQIPPGYPQQQSGFTFPPQAQQQAQPPPGEQMMQALNQQQPNAHRRAPSGVTLAQLHHRGPSLNGQPVTTADQITQLTEEERQAFLRDEANRAKRNHKIHMLSRDNGLMTPQDKNFITRIQLSQLVSAIGSADENGAESTHAEDFYYQVYSQIYSAALESGLNPDSFTQTYMNALSWKGGSKRYPRGGENQMRRMQQQVQRAVEAAKARPKNKQLVMEGSLGKISFSNAKTPKPLLNIKRNQSQDVSATMSNQPRAQDTVGGRKAVLRDIERVYSSLMDIEDCERSHPPQPREESSADEIQAFMDWRQRFTELNAKLWDNWKVQEPIDTLHPFMAMLSHPKGKKLVPRVFRQIDDQQRLIVLTTIVVQLDQLDVIRDVQPLPGRKELPLSVRHEADLFGQAVEPSLFAYVADAPLGHVTGLVGLVYQRAQIQLVMQACAGVNLLTRLLSRAAQLLNSSPNAQDAEQWNSTFNSLFEKMEPYLPNLFAAVITPGDDEFAWEFLAVCGVLASAQQQQNLVIAVKDNVMETVGVAKGREDGRGKAELDKVNLFMRAIGLDVDLLG